MNDDTPTTTGRRPEHRVALINGLVMMALPLIAYACVAPFVSGGSSTSATVYASGSSAFGRTIGGLLFATFAITPLAAVVVWRTSIHAARWLAKGTGDWRGVAEAGATGLTLALIPLLPGIITRPLDAPPYVIFYGGAGLLVGCILGLALRTTALIALRIGQ